MPILKMQLPTMSNPIISKDIIQQQIHITNDFLFDFKSIIHLLKSRKDIGSVPSLGDLFSQKVIRLKDTRAMDQLLGIKSNANVTAKYRRPEILFPFEKSRPGERKIAVECSKEIELRLA